MAKIILSPLAIQDLKDIYDYISLDSSYYAGIVIEKLLNNLSRLEDFPLKGRVVPEFENPLIREIFEYSYRIIYRIEHAELIAIARFFHQSRILKSIN
jgi:toxin ParE1/3/4